jgi:hypothetical protein
LPRKGYKCLTVSEKTHKEIRKKTAENKRTIKDYIESLIQNDITKEGT